MRESFDAHNALFNVVVLEHDLSSPVASGAGELKSLI